MPLVIVLLPLAILLLVLLVPISIVQRYRIGTSRRRARGWLTAVNAAGFGLSLLVALVGAAVATRWLPDAFRYALAGVTAGCALGLLGLLVTRWESRPDALHYTPSRWLVLAITIVVAARLLYGWLRMYHAWAARAGEPGWLAHAGAEGSLAAGVLVLAYYFTYWSGVRRRIRAHHEPAATRWRR
jgi:hypothetical protein